MSFNPTGIIPIEYPERQNASYILKNKIKITTWEQSMVDAASCTNSNYSTKTIETSLNDQNR